MTSSNAVFLPVTGPAPLNNVGWEVKCYKASDWTTLILNNPEFLTLTFSDLLSDQGGCSITFDQDQSLFQRTLIDGSPASDLVDKENLWSFYYEGRWIIDWLSQTVEEKPIEGEETRSIVISGPSGASVLKFASVLPPGFPNPTAFYYAFPPLDSPMKAYFQILTDAQGRGTIPFVAPTFTADHDSNGQAWVNSDEVALLSSLTGFYTPTPGTSLFDLLQTTTGQDPTQLSGMRADWHMRPGFKLDVVQIGAGVTTTSTGIGSHRENEVVFYEAGQILVKERTRTREQVQNYIATHSQADGSVALSSDGASIATFKQRESFFDLPALNDPSLLPSLGATYLAINKDETSSWTIKVSPDSPGRVVFQDYNLGDWIGIVTVLEPLTPYRVLGISGMVDNTGQFDLELTLESVLQYNQILLERQLVYLENRPPPPLPGLDGAGGPPGTVAVSNGDGSYAYVPTSDFGSGAGGSTGSTGGNTVYVQATDPSLDHVLSVGDMWIEL